MMEALPYALAALVVVLYAINRGHAVTLKLHLGPGVKRKR